MRKITKKDLPLPVDFLPGFNFYVQSPHGEKRKKYYVTLNREIVHETFSWLETIKIMKRGLSEVH